MVRTATWPAAFDGNTELPIPPDQSITATPLSNPEHANLHAVEIDILKKVEARIGLTGTADVTTLLGHTHEGTSFKKTVLDKATTKGDVIVYNGTAYVRVGVGTDGQVLTASAAAASGTAWVTPAGGSGAPTTVDYLVGTANATLSNEIVMGTTPGGEHTGSHAAPGHTSVHGPEGLAHHSDAHGLNGASHTGTVDNSKVAGPGSGFIVMKTAAQSLASNIVPQNDTHLRYTIVANKTYFFKLFLIVNGNATMDFGCAFAVPTGTTMRWGQLSSGDIPTRAGFTGDNGSVNHAALLDQTQAIDAASATTIGLSAGDVGLAFAGWVFGSSTVGDVIFKWAQAVSNATNLTLQIGSYMEVTLLN